MDRTLKCDHSLESYLAGLYCVFQFSQVRKFGKFVNFGLGTVRSEMVRLKYSSLHKGFFSDSCPYFDATFQ